MRLELVDKNPTRKSGVRDVRLAEGKIKSAGLKTRHYRGGAQPIISVRVTSRG